MRKRWTIVLVMLLAGTLLTTFQAQAQTSENLPGPRINHNPKPFDKFVAPVSGGVAFLFSQRGQEMLKVSPHPLAPFLLKVGGVQSTARGTLPTASGTSLVSRTSQTGVPTGIMPSFPGTVNSSCGTSFGTRFNLEGNGTSPAPFALPQNEESVDAIVGAGSSGADLVVEGANDYRGLFGALGSSLTGYYVQRSGTNCAPEFEGGAPPVFDPLSGATSCDLTSGIGCLLGGGDPVVARDTVHNAFFEADLRFSGSSPFTTAISVVRTDTTHLNSTASCPPGTQNTDTAAAACWPTGTAINPLPLAFEAYFNDKPHMTVDKRPSGTGAGNVYVTGTEFDFFTFFSRIWIVSCTNTLTGCSAPTLISGSDTATQFSHVSVRPDGTVTVTYDSFGFDPITFSPLINIQFVSCAPAAAPATPSCSPPTTVFHETRPLLALGSNDFRVSTYPKHDHRLNGAATETFVVWERCSVLPAFTVFGVCPKSNIVMSESNNGGATWSAPALVDTGAGDQFFCWINAERTTGTVNIDYYTAVADYFSHKVQVKLAQINPGGTFPEPIAGGTILTSTADDPAADPYLGDFFFGDYIGVVGVADVNNTVHRAYAAYTYNLIKQTYGGVSHTQQDNYLARFDY